jgi:hypothetical protein
MATPATVVVAVGAAGVRVVGAMTGRETVGLTVGLMADLIVGLTADRMDGLMGVHGVAPVAAARATLTLHATTLKPGSLRGDAAKSAMGVRSGGISCACMCATI